MTTHNTLWAIKMKHFYFFDNSDKYWPIFVIFSLLYTTKELRNKKLLKFLPHLKSVAALPCETWSVKCVDIQQGHIQFKTDSKCQVTVLTFSSSLFYIRCSKWSPFARTHAVSRARHWSIASSMTFCPMLCHRAYSTGANTAHRRHLRVSRRSALALQPRSYNPRGSYLGFLGATGREK